MDAQQQQVVFFGPRAQNGWMSNFSSYCVKYDGLSFPTAEHYFMYRKAKEFKDTRMIAAIYCVKTPLEAKRLGRKVGNFDEDKWDAVKEGIMLETLRLKLQSNPALVPLLKDTQGKLIAEASPRDKIWGIGLGAKRAAELGPALWPGQNLLGEAWMKLREEILKE